MDTLDLEIFQFAPALSDVESNSGRIADRARAIDAELLLTPELTLTGHDLGNDAIHLSRRIVAGQHLPDAGPPGEARPGVVLGPADRGDDAIPFVALAAVSGGAVRFCHRKVYLPTYGMFDEGGFWGRGERVEPWSFGAWTPGLPICEDPWHPALAHVLAESGVHALLVAAAAPGRGPEPDAGGEGRFASYGCVGAHCEIDGATVRTLRCAREPRRRGRWCDVRRRFDGRRSRWCSACAGRRGRGILDPRAVPAHGDRSHPAAVRAPARRRPPPRRSAVGSRPGAQVSSGVRRQVGAVVGGVMRQAIRDAGATGLLVLEIDSPEGRLVAESGAAALEPDKVHGDTMLSDGDSVSDPDRLAGSRRASARLVAARQDWRLAHPATRTVRLSSRSAPPEPLLPLGDLYASAVRDFAGACTHFPGCERDRGCWRRCGRAGQRAGELARGTAVTRRGDASAACGGSQCAGRPSELQPAAPKVAATRAETRSQNALDRYLRVIERGRIQW